MNFDGTNLTLNLPDISQWSVGEWLVFALALNALYGLITHLVSIPSIRRYNKLVVGAWDGSLREKYVIGDMFMIFLLLYRMTIQLPARAIAFILGSVGIVLGFIANMRFVNNVLFKFGWRWFSLDAILSEKSLYRGTDRAAYDLAAQARGK